MIEECRQGLKDYASIDKKAQRKIRNKYSELIEDDISGAKDLFMEFIELFDNDQSLSDTVDYFKEKYKGDIDALKAEKLLPLQEEKFKSLIKSFEASSEKHKQETASVLDQICKLKAKSAYKLYQAYEHLLNRNKPLKTVIENHWEEIIKHRLLPIDKTYKFLRKIKTVSIYYKSSDTLTKNEMSIIKNILVIGETENGKTTFINAMANYLMGVIYSDPIRVTLVPSKTGEIAYETTEVNTYLIKPKARYDCPIRIIDTPGYHETRDIGVNRLKMNMISSFLLKDCPNLHAICYVMKASSNKLTEMQAFSINQSLGIFGKDIPKNLVGVFTFADNGVPLAVETLKQINVPIEKAFKFNNLTLYPSVNEEDEPALCQFNWDMFHKNFSLFFDYLHKVRPLSLNLTREVLKKRKALDNETTILQRYIIEGSNIKNNLEKNLHDFLSNAEKIENNEQFTYTVKEEVKVQKKAEPGRHIMNCVNCNNMPCHLDCSITDNDDMRNCSLMNEKGYCTVCPGKCPWNKHKNFGYYYEIEYRDKTYTWEETKKQYSKGVNELQHLDDNLLRNKNDIQGISKKILESFANCSRIINELSEKSLLNSLNDISDSMNFLIELEINNKAQGYLERIRNIEDLKDKYKLLQNTKNIKTLFDIDDINRMLTQYEEQKKKLQRRALIIETPIRGKGDLDTKTKEIPPKPKVNPSINAKKNTGTSSMKKTISSAFKNQRGTGNTSNMKIVSPFPYMNSLPKEKYQSKDQGKTTIAKPFIADNKNHTIGLNKKNNVCIDYSKEERFNQYKQLHKLSTNEKKNEMIIKNKSNLPPGQKANNIGINSFNKPGEWKSNWRNGKEISKNNY